MINAILTYIYSALLWAYIILFFALVPLFAFPFSLIFGLKRSFRMFFKLFVKAGLAAFCLTPSVSGIENLPSNKNVILVSNHTGLFDPFALNAALPGFLNFIVFAKLLDNAYTWCAFRFSGVVIRHYGHSLSGSRAIISSLNAINGGDSFILFPSERVIPEGTIDKISPGLYRIIQDTDAVILPVHITGGLRFRFLQKPSRPKIVIGKPIDKQRILYGRDEVIKKAIRNLG